MPEKEGPNNNGHTARQYSKSARKRPPDVYSQSARGNGWVPYSSLRSSAPPRESRSNGPSATGQNVYHQKPHNLPTEHHSLVEAGDEIKGLDNYGIGIWLENGEYNLNELLEVYNGHDTNYQLFTDLINKVKDAVKDYSTKEGRTPKKLAQAKDSIVALIKFLVLNQRHEGQVRFQKPGPLKPRS